MSRGIGSVKWRTDHISLDLQVLTDEKWGSIFVFRENGKNGLPSIVLLCVMQANWRRIEEDWGEMRSSRKEMRVTAQEPGNSNRSRNGQREMLSCPLLASDDRKERKDHRELQQEAQVSCFTTPSFLREQRRDHHTLISSPHNIKDSRKKRSGPRHASDSRKDVSKDISL